MTNWYEGKIDEPLVRLELEKRRAELTARVAAAWQVYRADTHNPWTEPHPFDIYRALADELEQATGFAVTCGVLTGRPA